LPTTSRTPRATHDQRRRPAFAHGPKLIRVREQAREQKLTLLTAPPDDESESKAIESSVEAQQPVRIGSIER